MRIIFLIALAVFLESSILGQVSDQDKKLSVATDWLYRLCVVPNGDFQAMSPNALRDAFDSWVKKSQDGGSCDPKTFADAKDSTLPIRVDVSSIRLNAWERIARMPQFRTQIQQTPDYVYGILQGAPANTLSQFFPNPDHAILSYGGPIHFDELYVSADTRVAICTVLDDVNTQIKKSDPTANPPTDQRCTEPGYLLANRARDNLTRIGAAVTLDISFSQVPKYQAPIIITSFSGLNFPSYSKTITGSFDTSKLFRSAAELKGVAGYVGKLNPKTSAISKDAVLQDFCRHKADDLADERKTADCIRAITIGDVPKRLAISLMPRVDVKATSPFDLSKYGTSFIAPPNRAGRSLYSVTLNWDLRSLIPSTKDRLDAFNALKALHDPAMNPADDKQTKEALWRRQVSSLYLELSRMPERSLDAAWWARFEATVLRVD